VNAPEATIASYRSSVMQKSGEGTHPGSIGDNTDWVDAIVDIGWLRQPKDGGDEAIGVTGIGAPGPRSASRGFFAVNGFPGR